MSWTRRHKNAAIDCQQRSRTMYNHHQARLIWAKSLWCVGLLTGIQPNVIEAGGKPQDIAYARMVCMALVSEFSGHSDKTVADAIGCDRTTVANAIEKIPAFCRSNPSVADVWRDAKRIMTLEVQNAANEGLLDAYRPRRRDHGHPQWAAPSQNESEDV